jgi:hypothetical protein
VCDGQRQGSVPALAGSHDRGTRDAEVIQHCDEVIHERKCRVGCGGLAVAAGVVPKDTEVVRERWEYVVPDTGIAYARVKQHQRWQVTAAVVCPNLAALNGHHRFRHEILRPV